jgi:hypothetical protein
MRTAILFGLAIVLALPVFAGTTPKEKPLEAAVEVVDVTRDSLLRVNSNNQAFDFFQPWRKKPPFSRRGLGVLIEGGRILVTAELVANSNFIEIEKPATAQKSSAVVERVDYDCNLAVLKPADPAFIEGMRPVPLNGAVKVGSELEVLQLEPNGEIARTTGRVSSIGVGGYPFENLGLLVFKASVPLQQRDGSFTLPAVKDGKLVGLLMRYDARNQTAEIVPTPVVRHFLKEIEGGNYQGFARLGIGFASLRDPQLRRHVKLAEPGGIYVTEVVPGGSAALAGIRKGDVLLEIDGKAIDQDGNYEDPEFGRILFGHITSTVLHPGAKVPVRISRDGKIEELTVVLNVPERSRVVSEAHMADRAPRYFVLGGLVFVELSRAYLQEWGSDWAKSAPQRLVYYDAFQNELPEDRGKIVVLAQVLPTPDTLGYEDLQNHVVERVNGRTVRRLEDLAAAAKEPVEGFHKIELEEDPKWIFLDAQSVEANRDGLKKHYALPAGERF